MPATSHPEFYSDTEALEVAKAFPEAIRGKTVIVTGCNRGGIGFTTAQAFASQSPSNIVIAGRTPSKLQEAVKSLREEYPDVSYHTLQIDLSSQKSVRAAAAEFLSRADPPAVDILVNSAGIMLGPEKPRTLSEDGIELHFATNHVGHFLFTNLILPKLIRAAKSSPRGAVRIINVTSASPLQARMRWSDPNFEVKNKDLPEAEQPPYAMHKAWGDENSREMTYVPIEGYNQSKVANVLFGIGATRRLYEKYGILSLAVHPGVIKTELARGFSEEALKEIFSPNNPRRLVLKSLGAGSSTSLVAALDPRLGPGEAKDGKENYGAYLADCQIDNGATDSAVSSSAAERLWDVSEKLVGEKFDW